MIGTRIGLVSRSLRGLEVIKRNGKRDSKRFKEGFKKERISFVCLQSLQTILAGFWGWTWGLERSSLPNNDQRLLTKRLKCHEKITCCSGSWLDVTECTLRECTVTGNMLVLTDLLFKDSLALSPNGERCSMESWAARLGAPTPSSPFGEQVDSTYHYPTKRAIKITSNYENYEKFMLNVRSLLAILRLLTEHNAPNTLRATWFSYREILNFIFDDHRQRSGEANGNRQKLT